MPRQNPALFSFNRGEVSKIALARVDLEKLRLAAQVQVNFVPFVLGPMMLRPGMYYFGNTLNDSKAKLVPFVFAKLDTAMLELTGGFMRVRINNVLLTRPSVSTTVIDPTFQSGTGWDVSGSTSGASVTTTGGTLILQCLPVNGLAQVQKQIGLGAGASGLEHGLRIVVTNGPVTVRAGSSFGATDLISQTVLDTGTHSLSFVPTTDIFLQIESTDAWNKTITSIAIELGGPFAIPTPWAEGAFGDIRRTQSGDVVYVAAYGNAQYKIERRGTRPFALGWSIVRYRSSDGPFQLGPAIKANLTPGNYYGNTTLTSDRRYFQEGHVGCLFRLFSSGQTNAAILGGANAFTPAVRVVGVGSLARDYNWTVSGTYVGALTLQRSFDGPDRGFSDVASAVSGYTGALSSQTGGTAGIPDLDNSVCWERVGFKGGVAYTSGTAVVSSAYAGGGGYGICRVTGWVSPTVVQIEVLQPFTSITATDNWVEQDWSGVVGYPTSVAIHEGRLFWLGRDKLWGSGSDDFTGFAEIDSQGNDVGADGPITETFGEGPVDTVSWALSLTRLLCGRDGSVASVRSGSLDEVLTPTNPSTKDCSTHGAAHLPAIKIDKYGVYVDESGGRVYRLTLGYTDATLDYSPHDMTRLNHDIGGVGFTAIDARRMPDTEIYLPRGDGQCAVCLDDIEDDVEAWWRIQTLGVIEDVAVLPTPGGSRENAVYFVVRRTINGIVKRFYEQLVNRVDAVGNVFNEMADAMIGQAGAPTKTMVLPHLPNSSVVVWADGAPIGTAETDASGTFTMPDGEEHATIAAGLAGEVVTQTGDPASVMTGLARYEGLPCIVFADRKYAGTLVVSAAKLTLPNGVSASTIIAIFGYVGVFQSAKLAYAAQQGSPLTQKKKIDHVGLVGFDMHPLALQIGQSFEAMDSLPRIEEDAELGAAQIWSEYDEPMFEVPGEWDTDARLCMLAMAPYPVKVGAVVVAITTNEKT